PLGVPVALSDAGTASFSATLSSLGSHRYTAQYSGDANFKPGTSAVLTRSVAKDKTSLTLTASASSPIALNQTFGLSIHLSTLAPGAAPLEGNRVTLKDGSRTLGTLTLDAQGNASFAPLNFSSAGAHTFTALYAGDPVTSSVSSTLKLTIA